MLVLAWQNIIENISALKVVAEEWRDIATRLLSGTITHEERGHLRAMLQDAELLNDSETEQREVYKNETTHERTPEEISAVGRK